MIQCNMTLSGQKAEYLKEIMKISILELLYQNVFNFGYWPGGTPEEIVEEDSRPWPLEVIPATSIVYVVRAVRPVTLYSRVTFGR